MYKTTKNSLSLTVYACCLFVDPNHDYSQSKSPSRMVTLDRLHSKVSPTKHPITISQASVEKIQEQVANGTSLYHAALKRSPYKEIVPSDRDLNNRLSHSGKRTMEAMSEEEKPHLLNFHRRADDVVG